MAIWTFRACLLTMSLQGIGSVCYAAPEAIKLKCGLTVTNHPYEMPAVVSHEDAEVELQIDNEIGLKTIIVNSLAVPVAVANGKSGSIKSFRDFSTDTRVEVWNMSRIGENSVQEQMAAVDRSTGSVKAMVMTTISTATNTATIRVEAIGSCTKVDTSKLRF
jgi:hypothetical protein